MADQMQVKSLVWLLRDSDEAALAVAVNALLGLGPMAIDPFVASLLGEDGDVWDRAVEVLSRIGKLALEPLIQVLADHHRDCSERIGHNDNRKDQ